MHRGDILQRFNKKVLMKYLLKLTGFACVSSIPLRTIANKFILFFNTCPTVPAGVWSTLI